MKKLAIILLALFGQTNDASAFCGFYVAKADASLFNTKSQVIIVRDGDYSVITMSNDFKGDVKDFAMVVPVPVVLQKEDIKVVNANLFQKLDSYSAPRIVQYFDSNPCYDVYELDGNMPASLSEVTVTRSSSDMKKEKSLGVTIEARYTVGEYDILLLSAKESVGLKTWLISNGYKIPATAEEVLEPYIKSNMKFFVVKVNLERQLSSNFESLRPIQIRFNSPKFMLPIRLGMANANGPQDMIVYAFTKTGRVEAVNYRTVKVPTDRNIPVFVQQKFGQFYKSLFDRAYRREGRNTVFLEYAWNVSPQNNIKCDPCVSTPPVFSEFSQAGVNWASPGSQVFFTRMHVRYTRDKFPQDLVFQITPNRENYQARYVITHAATGDLSCDEGKSYMQNLKFRRSNELDELASLTGWDVSGYRETFEKKNRYEENILPILNINNWKKTNTILILILSIISIIIVALSFRSTKEKTAV